MCVITIVMIKKSNPFTVILLIAIADVMAQGVLLYGKVCDETGEPMELVHIRLSKGSIGTLSNFKGEYELKVPKSDSLRVIFTSLGYKRVERLINASSDKIKLDVVMKQNTAVISDVEVTTNQRNTNTLEK